MIESFHVTRLGSFRIKGWWGKREFEACIAPDCHCMGVVLIIDGVATPKGTMVIKKLLDLPDIIFNVSENGRVLDFQGKTALAEHCKAHKFLKSP